MVASGSRYNEKFMDKLQRFLRSRSEATAIEYGPIAAGICMTIICQYARFTNAADHLTVESDWTSIGK